MEGVLLTDLPQSWKPDELERELQERLDALGPALRAELLLVVLLRLVPEPRTRLLAWSR